MFPSYTKEEFTQLVHEGLQEVESLHALLIRLLTEHLEKRGSHKAVARIRALSEEDAVAPEPGPLSRDEVQALSYHAQLLNLTEESVANHMRGRRESVLGAEGNKGHWMYHLKRLRMQGFDADALRADLPRTRSEVVFTKHPTEAKRWSVLRIHREIVELLEERRSRAMGFELDHNTRRLSELIERLWLTGEVFPQKPGVHDELKNLLYYLTEIFPDALEEVDSRLDYAWQQTWPEAKPLHFSERPRFDFGSWVGGDRDGHPFVTAEVTAETLNQLRNSALDVIRKHLKRTASRLQFATKQTPPPRDLIRAIKAFGASTETETPWAAYLYAIEERVDSMQRAELREYVANLGHWLQEAQADQFERIHIKPLKRMIDTIGLHLVRLDIRQNSAFHEKALIQMMVHAGIEDAANFPNWSETAQLAFLEKELSSKRPLTHSNAYLPAEASAVRDCLQVIARHIRKYGSDGIGVLIISMTRSVIDLLTVYVLCKEAGLCTDEGKGMRCALPVVPLFETFDDLEAAPGICKDFLKHPITRRSLKAIDAKRPTQVVMVGYSDSNKDAGILSSQWALHRAQRKLLEVGKANKIEIQFFHGRGGTIGRGAGPMHRFLEALPPHSLEGGLRLTEQGEVIGQKYNTRETAAANLESLVASTFGAIQTGRKRSLLPEFVTILDDLSIHSKQAYRELIEQPGFIEFYRQVTPIDAIEKSRIGSRPSRRTGQATLEDLRAIPWVFSWNQCRYYLTGWYGVGTALTLLEQQSPEQHAHLCAHINSAPFTHYLFSNIESSLFSANEDWMVRYAELVEDPALRERFFTQLNDERKRTHDQLARIFSKPLEERRPRFWKTLIDREAMLSLLHQEQIERLRKLRSGGGDDEQTTDELLLVINAIASGLRTTG